MANLIYKKGNKFNTKFVNKYGIAFECDYYPDIFISDLKEINFKDYSNISSGSLVYVISSALRSWFKEIYPILLEENKVVILVTGDSVENAPLGALGINIEEFQKLRDEGIIYHWFCQNCDVVFEDYVTPIPLGIDYHTLHRKNFWGEKKTDFIYQDINLNLISRKRFNDFNKRKVKLICDIHLNKGNFNKERQIAYRQSLKIKNALFINKPISRSNFWRIMRNSKYIISPRGRGFDCHRTWEALVLGVVPIIKTSVNDILFKEMPVLVVDSFEDISDNLLDRNNTFAQCNLKKISLDYWIDILRQKKRLLNNKITNDKSPSLKFKKKYSLSIFKYFTKDLILIIISNPRIIILFLNSFLKILFYPFLVFKDIFIYILGVLITKI